MDLIYRHTQIGYTILITLGVIILAMLVSFAFDAPGKPAYIIMSLICAIVINLFATLTIGVSDAQLHAHFGPIPLISFKWDRTDIASVKKVRNHWIYGWGIHLTLHGWLFNVSGLDAVEITKTNGKTFRLGTDDSENLVNILTGAIQPDYIEPSRHISDFE